MVYRNIIRRIAILVSHYICEVSRCPSAVSGWYRVNRLQKIHICNGELTVLNAIKFDSLNVWYCFYEINVLFDILYKCIQLPKHFFSAATAGCSEQDAAIRKNRWVILRAWTHEQFFGATPRKKVYKQDFSSDLLVEISRVSRLLSTAYGV